MKTLSKDITIVTNRKNFIITNFLPAGRVEVLCGGVTDEELADSTDFFEFAKITSLKVGESYYIEGESIVTRIA